MSVEDRIAQNISACVRGNHTQAAEVLQRSKRGDVTASYAMVKLGVISRDDAIEFISRFDVGHEMVLPERAREDHR